MFGASIWEGMLFVGNVWGGVASIEVIVSLNKIPPATELCLTWRDLGEEKQSREFHGESDYTREKR